VSGKDVVGAIKVDADLWLFLADHHPAKGTPSTIPGSFGLVTGELGGFHCRKFFPSALLSLRVPR